MKVLHLLSSGGIGGIEVLIKDICLNSDWENHVCVLLFGGRLTEEMKDSGVTVFELYGGRLFSLRRLFKLLKLVRTERYDIVNIHHEGAIFQFYYIVLMVLVRGLKGVMTLHSCFQEGVYYNKKSRPAQLLVKRFIAATIRHSDLIVGVSKAAIAFYSRAFNIDAAKTAVVYNGVSEDLLKRGRSNVIKTSPPLRVLYVGRIVAVKGIGNLIEAMRLLKGVLDIRLTVVGDGGDRKAFEMLSNKYGLKDMVVFTGYDRDVEKYYGTASLFVYPSIWEEAFGISIIEAMSFGLPVVVNRRGGMPEIVRDGVDGYLTAEPTAKGLADAIRRAAADFTGETVECISLAAKERAAGFSIKHTVSALENAYSALLGPQCPQYAAVETSRQEQTR